MKRPFCKSFLLISCKLMGVGALLSPSVGSPYSQVVAQADAGDAQEQTYDHACAYIGGSAGPLAILQHLGGFPAETGERCVASEETDGNGHAPVRRNHQAIERELANQAEQEATGQIDQQRAKRKSARRADLHDALEAVARERTDGAEDRNQRKTQFLSNLQPARERQ